MTDDVVAPEALLFYRADCASSARPARQGRHRARRNCSQRQDKLPTRYQKLADLMRHDLAG